MSARLATVYRPIDLSTRFTSAMSGFGPFEGRPHLAVAVSGGADSTALAILALDWARARGGKITALIVDHHLRPESGDEAIAVATRLHTLKTEAVVLKWRGHKPKRGIQAAARDARYRLLGDWCRRNGVLHLLVGHHAGDQQETVAMRMAHDSGPAGRAGMSAVVERDGYRVLRPLLGEPKVALTGFLRRAGHDWLEDPSNADPRFERTRVRRALAGVTPMPGRQAAAAALRRRVDGDVATLLGSAAMLHPLGYAVLDLDIAVAYRADVVASALGALIAWAGGGVHPPSSLSLRRTWRGVRDLAPGKAMTLGRCQVRRGTGALLILREMRGLPAPVSAGAAQSRLWDGRFVVTSKMASQTAWQVAPLGHEGATRLAKDGRLGGLSRAPHLALATLPAFRSARGQLCVPNLGHGVGRKGQFSAVLRPRRTLVSPTFAVA